MWVRGLKRRVEQISQNIEASHPVWVRGLKLVNPFRLQAYQKVAPRVGAWIETPVLEAQTLITKVAPRVGAWIETEYSYLSLVGLQTSHPVWVRGLKQNESNKKDLELLSHPVWVRGLKQDDLRRCAANFRSHPVWVRGLKLSQRHRVLAKVTSHPVWVRGLKLIRHLPWLPLSLGRTPCGCVD